MPNFKKKGLVNQHTRVESDPYNISNKNNKHIYGQVLEGNARSLTIEYFLNLGSTRLNDFKSIGMYNEMNLAAQINEVKEMEEILDGNEIELKKPSKRIKKYLSDVLEERHSSRFFADIYMGQKDFSTIMHYSFGLGKRKVNYNGIITTTRHYPSGGGLYPIEIYVLINKVNGIQLGLYKYQPHSHTLYPVKCDFNIETFLEHSNFDYQNYSFLVLYKFDINKSYLKYGELSLLITLVELGDMVQNFDLVVTSLDYSSCQIAGFDKSYANEVIGLDGVNSHIIFTSICGRE